jgi:hypothetical protein
LIPLRFALQSVRALLHFVRGFLGSTVRCASLRELGVGRRFVGTGTCLILISVTCSRASQTQLVASAIELFGRVLLRARLLGLFDQSLGSGEFRGWLMGRAAGA